MKKAKWLWTIPTALALACAFFLPRLLLHFEQEQALSQVETYDAANGVLNYDKLTIAQKQAILAEGNYSALDVEQEKETLSTAAIREAFFAELDELHAYGAISDYSYANLRDQFSQGLSATCFLVVDRIGNIAFRYYEIYSAEGWAYAVYDPESGKILHLVDMLNGYRAVAEMIETQDLGEPSPLEEMIRGWGLYYGLTVSDVSVFREDEYKSTGDYYDFYLARCCLYDESGNRVPFAVRFQSDLGILAFTGIPQKEWEVLSDAVSAEAVPAQ